MRVGIAEKVLKVRGQTSRSLWRHMHLSSSLTAVRPLCVRRRQWSTVGVEADSFYLTVIFRLHFCQLPNKFHGHFATPLEYVISSIGWSPGWVRLLNHIYLLTLTAVYRLKMSLLKVNNRSFRHASPRLWNKLPKELRQPVDDESLSLSSHLSLTGSSSSSPSSSPLSLCITPSLFHSRLKTYLFHKSFPP